MRLFTFIAANILALTLIISACGDGFNDGSNYGDLLNSPEGLVLTPEEHQGGWGRYDCFTCHPVHNIHLNNYTSIEIDMNEVRTLTVSQGEAGCSSCHGSNGLF